jgi:hypothetical protein
MKRPSGFMDGLVRSCGEERNRSDAVGRQIEMLPAR